MGKVPILIAVVVCLGVGATSAETIRNDDIGFTLELPEVVGEIPQLTSRPEIICAYTIREATETDPLLTFSVQRLGDRIGSDAARKEYQRYCEDGELPRGMKEMMPPGAEFSMDVIAEKWQGFTIHALRMRVQHGENALIVCTAGIPLKREAVSVSVCCEGTNEEEGRQLLRTLLANLKGESSWLPDGRELGPRRWSDERLEHLFEGLKDLFMWAVIIGVVIYFARRRKRAKQAQQAAAPTPPVAPPPEEPKET